MGKKIKEDTWYKLKNGEIQKKDHQKNPIDPKRRGKLFIKYTIT